MFEREFIFAYLTSSTMYSEAEEFITAVQDGVFHTSSYAKHVLGMPLADIHCRSCKIYEKTVMHLLSACPRYALTLYIDRPDMALKMLHYHIKPEYEVGD
ncbi:hypothetical protein Trydic_g17620 [Trypoxylus dichotomus]